MRSLSEAACAAAPAGECALWSVSKLLQAVRRLYKTPISIPVPAVTNMSRMIIPLVATLLFASAYHAVCADQVQILAADFHHSDGNRWSVNVALRHADSGWDHYADRWRILDAEGNVLGVRVLHHPHVNEQPFTRGLTGVELPEGVSKVFVEAHDTMHGWASDRLSVDLSRVVGGRMRVEAE